MFELNASYRNAREVVREALRRAKTKKGVDRIDRFLSVQVCPDCAGTRLSVQAHFTLSTWERQRVQLSRAVLNRTTTSGWRPRGDGSVVVDGTIPSATVPTSPRTMSVGPWCRSRRLRASCAGEGA